MVISAVCQSSTPLLNNIEAINFRNPTTPACCGRLNITDSTTSSEVIRANSTSVLAVSNYGQGKAVILASHLLFEEATLLKDKNWVFLLRNAIKYAYAAAEQNNVLNYEVLAVGISPKRSYR